MTPSDPTRVTPDSPADEPPIRPRAGGDDGPGRNQLRFLRRRTVYDGRGNDNSDGPDGLSITAARLVDRGTGEM